MRIPFFAAAPLVTLTAASAFLVVTIIDASEIDQTREPANVRTAALDTGTLRSHLEGSPLKIGSAVADRPLRFETPYATTLALEFNAVTPENSMKWAQIHPEPDRYDFAQSDRLVSFAKTHDMLIRGHVLVGHEDNPAWLEAADLSRPEAIEVMRDHITTVVERYKGSIAQWDVVNEPLVDDASGELRASVWQRLIGDDYIALAFRFARQADPDAQLFLNEYDGISPGYKTDNIIALARDLLDQNAPIDGIGFQFHILNGIDQPAVAAKLREVSDLGLEIAMTEVDNGLDDPGADGALDEQAAVFGGLLSTCIENERCNTFVMWGFTDRHSWIPEKFPGYFEATIFDEQLAPKSAYSSLHEALGSMRPSL